MTTRSWSDAILNIFRRDEEEEEEEQQSFGLPPEDQIRGVPSTPDLGGWREEERMLERQKSLTPKPRPIAPPPEDQIPGSTDRPILDYLTPRDQIADDLAPTRVDDDEDEDKQRRETYREQPIYGPQIPQQPQQSPTVGRTDPMLPQLNVGLSVGDRPDTGPASFTSQQTQTPTRTTQQTALDKTPYGPWWKVAEEEDEDTKFDPIAKYRENIWNKRAFPEAPDWKPGVTFREREEGEEGEPEIVAMGVEDYTPTPFREKVEKFEDWISAEGGRRGIDWVRQNILEPRRAMDDKAREAWDYYNKTGRIPDDPELASAFLTSMQTGQGGAYRGNAFFNTQKELYQAQMDDRQLKSQEVRGEDWFNTAGSEIWQAISLWMPDTEEIWSMPVDDLIPILLGGENQNPAQAHSIMAWLGIPAMGEIAMRTPYGLGIVNPFRDDKIFNPWNQVTEFIKLRDELLEVEDAINAAAAINPDAEYVRLIVSSGPDRARNALDLVMNQERYEAEWKDKAYDALGEGDAAAFIYWYRAAEELSKKNTIQIITENENHAAEFWEIFLDPVQIAETLLTGGGRAVAQESIEKVAKGMDLPRLVDGAPTVTGVLKRAFPEVFNGKAGSWYDLVQNGGQKAVATADEVMALADEIGNGMAKQIADGAVTDITGLLHKIPVVRWMTPTRETLARADTRGIMDMMLTIIGKTDDPESVRALIKRMGSEKGMTDILNEFGFGKGSPLSVRDITWVNNSAINQVNKMAEVIGRRKAVMVELANRIDDFKSLRIKSRGGQKLVLNPKAFQVELKQELLNISGQLYGNPKEFRPNWLTGNIKKALTLGFLGQPAAAIRNALGGLQAGFWTGSVGFNNYQSSIDDFVLKLGHGITDMDLLDDAEAAGRYMVGSSGRGNWLDRANTWLTQKSPWNAYGPDNEIGIPFTKKAIPWSEGAHRMNHTHTWFRRAVDQLGMLRSRPVVVDQLVADGLPEYQARWLAKTAVAQGVKGNADSVRQWARTVVGDGGIPDTVEDLMIPRQILIDGVDNMVEKVFAQVRNGEVTPQEAENLINQAFDKARLNNLQMLGVTPTDTTVRFLGKTVDATATNDITQMLTVAKRNGLKLGGIKGKIIQTVSKLASDETNIMRKIAEELAMLPNTPGTHGLISDVMSDYYFLKGVARQQIDELYQIHAPGGSAASWEEYFRGYTQIQDEFGRGLNKAFDDFLTLATGAARDPDYQHNARSGFDKLMDTWLKYDEDAMQQLKEMGLGLGQLKKQQGQFKKVRDGYRQMVDSSVAMLFEAFRANPTTDNFDLMRHALQGIESMGAQTARFMGIQRARLTNRMIQPEQFYAIRNWAWGELFEAQRLYVDAWTRVVVSDLVAEDAKTLLTWTDQVGKNWRLFGPRGKGIWEAIDLESGVRQLMSVGKDVTGMPRVPDVIYDDYMEVVNKSSDSVQKIVRDLERIVGIKPKQASTGIPPVSGTSVPTAARRAGPTAEDVGSVLNAQQAARAGKGSPKLPSTPGSFRIGQGVPGPGDSKTTAEAGAILNAQQAARSGDNVPVRPGGSLYSRGTRPAGAEGAPATRDLLDSVVGEATEDAADIYRLVQAGVKHSKKWGEVKTGPGDAIRSWADGLDVAQSRAIRAVRSGELTQPKARIDPKYRTAIVKSLDNFANELEGIYKVALLAGKDVANHTMIDFDYRTYGDNFISQFWTFPHFWVHTPSRMIKNAMNSSMMRRFYYEYEMTIQEENDDQELPRRLAGTLPNPLATGSPPAWMNHPLLRWMVNERINLTPLLLPFLQYASPNPYVRPDEAESEIEEGILNFRSWVPEPVAWLGMLVDGTMDITNPKPDDENPRLSNYAPMDWFGPFADMYGYGMASLTGEMPPGQGMLNVGGMDLLGTGDSRYDTGVFARELGPMVFDGDITREQAAWALDVGMQKKYGLKPLPGQPEDAEKIWQEAVKRGAREKFTRLLGRYVSGVNTYEYDQTMQEIMELQRLYRGGAWQEGDPYEFGKELRKDLGAEETSGGGEVMDTLSTMWSYGDAYAANPPPEDERPGAEALRGEKEELDAQNRTLREQWENVYLQELFRNNPNPTDKEISEAKAKGREEAARDIVGDEVADAFFADNPKDNGYDLWRHIQEGFDQKFAAAAPWPAKSVKGANPNEILEIELENVKKGWFGYPGMPEYPEGGTKAEIYKYYEEKDAWDEAKEDWMRQQLTGNPYIVPPSLMEGDDPMWDEDWREFFRLPNESSIYMENPRTVYLRNNPDFAEHIADIVMEDLKYGGMSEEEAAARKRNEEIEDQYQAGTGGTSQWGDAWDQYRALGDDWEAKAEFMRNNPEFAAYYKAKYGNAWWESSSANYTSRGYQRYTGGGGWGGGGGYSFGGNTSSIDSGTPRQYRLMRPEGSNPYMMPTVRDLRSASRTARPRASWREAYNALRPRGLQQWRP